MQKVEQRVQHPNEVAKGHMNTMKVIDYVKILKVWAIVQIGCVNDVIITRVEYVVAFRLNDSKHSYRIWLFVRMLELI